uniref:Uncharacterized protein n=1 Tax=Eutreptiella gymnastica TaxID=73025 RepID=A0A7S1I3A2_9EUGL|mmetsp:Transcript_125612/g.217826  ORF Transcript_125612/g.217826 Transcript_125612/m.217826 type:complete len:110 (+) Transcript_125612:2577-2906(+)
MLNCCNGNANGKAQMLQPLDCMHTTVEDMKRVFEKLDVPPLAHLCLIAIQTGGLAKNSANIHLSGADLAPLQVMCAEYKLRFVPCSNPSVRSPRGAYLAVPAVPEQVGP